MANLGGGIFLGIFGLFWCSFVFFVDGLLTWNAVRQVRANSYATTTGTITRAELKVVHGDGDSYQPEVLYQYEVAGQPYDGRRIRYDSTTLGKAHSESIVARYAAGQTVPVHYDPQAPGEAVLELGLEAANLLGLLFLTPFNAVAFLFAGGFLAWVRSRQLGRPVLGIAVRDDGLGLTIRIYDLSPTLVGIAISGATGFVSVFTYLLLTMYLPLAVTLALLWCVTLVAGLLGWWFARRKFTELRHDLLHGRLEVRQRDGQVLSIAQDDLRPVRFSRRTSRDAEGQRVERFQLTLPYFDSASQAERSLQLPEQTTAAAAERFAAWLNRVLEPR